MADNKNKVGGIDRNTKKCFLKVIEKRDANALTNVITEFVEPGTTIITDCWRGYNTQALLLSGFDHFSVNHSYNFVHPNDCNVHTQGIESNWARIKRDMRRQIGRMSSPNIETYLTEYTWRSLHKTNEELFFDFVNVINYFNPN